MARLAAFDQIEVGRDVANNITPEIKPETKDWVTEIVENLGKIRLETQQGAELTDYRVWIEIITESLQNHSR
jgi:hypothetical protein